MKNPLTSNPTSLAGIAHCDRCARARSLARLAVLVLAGLAGSGVFTAPAALAEESCPNAASRQGPSLALPECRVYEQVTPVDKGDALDLFQSTTYYGGAAGAEPLENERASVAEDGDAILLETRATLSSGSAVSPSAYVFPLVSPVPQTQVTSPEVFDPVDLSKIGFLDKVGSYADLKGGDPSALQDSLMVGPVGGPYATMYSLSGAAAYEGYGATMVGGSENLSDVLLDSKEHGLIPGGVAEGQVEGSNALYEWVDGGLQPVNVNNDGSLVSTCGANLGQGGSGEGDPLGSGAAQRAVSSDGSKVFFTAPDPGDPEGGAGCWNPGASPQENPPEVYMRERQPGGSDRTVEVSVPEAGVEIDAENPLQPAAFVGASADGSKVFFITKTQLIGNATGHEPELYEYETETGRLTLISTSESEPEGNVDFVGAVSSDGQAVYFTAFGDLAPGAAEGLKPGNPFSPVNLYRYDSEAAEGHRLTFVTTIDAGDFPLTVHGVKGEPNWTKDPGAFGGLGAGRAKSVGLYSGAEWYTTGNGGFLVFGSYRPITGFDDNRSPGPLSCQNLIEAEGEGLERCMELFRYDAATGGVVCVSCAGGAPVDNATFTRDASGLNSAGSPRPISEDGSVVFFDSEDVLVPQAVPDRVHVYEWHEGMISLISAPGDPGNAFFLGASTDGKNVFFSTHAQLALSDTDQATDIYDARVDGGFEGAAPQACTGTGCQGVPAAPPVFATPASVTFEGIGNFPVPGSPPTVVKPKPKTVKCPKGKTRNKHKQCVKKSKSKKAKKSSRKKGR
jgi:hypothetical protein